MNDSPFAAVVKVGGSLSRGVDLPGLCHAMAELASRHRLLVVPGGGAFADSVRVAAHRYALDDDVAHWMAILAMDQYGYLLTSLTPRAVAVRDVAAAMLVAAQGRLPVLLPFDMLRRRDPLPHTWDVTSDSIAAWICWDTTAARLILLKDVDGLHTTDPRRDPASTLLSYLDVSQLAGIQGVDAYLQRVVPHVPGTVWVLNGRHMGRLATVLNGEDGQVIGTRLTPA